MSSLRAGGLRRRLLVVVTLGAILTLAVLTAGFNVVLARRLDADANALLRTRVSSELPGVRSDGGKLSLGDARGDTEVDAETWVYAGRRAIVRPRARADTQAAADGLATGPARTITTESTDTRLRAVPIMRGRRRLGTLVGGLSLAPYERSELTSLIASLGFAGLIAIAIAVAARWVIGGALHPVARMTSAAAEWGDHDLDRRFALGPPRDELTLLAATFDDLLDRLSASLRREQRFTAEVSHELRTPLARISAEAELALAHERTASDYRTSLVGVRRNADQLASTLEALMVAARGEAGGARGTADAGDAARRVAEASRELAGERAIDLTATANGEARVRADVQVVERALAPVVENACRYARSRVGIEVERHNGQVVIAVDDDGGGVSDEERERIFEPGARGAAARLDESVDGAGLGLSLSRRVARAAGGDVECVDSAAGTRFVLRLPAA